MLTRGAIVLVVVSSEQSVGSLPAPAIDDVRAVEGVESAAGNIWSIFRTVDEQGDVNRAQSDQGREGRGPRRGAVISAQTRHPYAADYGCRATPVIRGLGVMDVRLICEDCGVKWFVPGNGDAIEEPPECAACGGQLVVFDAPGGDTAPGWTTGAE